MGDWNAIVGEDPEGGFLGKYGLGKRNERGARLIEFCTRHNLVITNTLFQHHKRRRYTWKAPGDLRRQQIDYILVKTRFRNQVKDCRSYPSADIDSDHNLVMMKSSLRFKGLKKKMTKQKWEVERLKTEKIANLYAKTTDKADGTSERSDVNKTWTQIKTDICEAAEKVIGKTKPENRREWITADVIQLIDKKRLYKNATDEKGKAEYRRLRNLVNREAKKAKEEFLEGMCREVEENMRNGRTDIAYRITNTFFNKRKTTTAGSIEGKDGEMLFGEDMVKRWKQYIEELYSGEPLPENIIGKEDEVDEDDRGDYIMEEEFERALKDLRDRKAAGIDDIPAEMIKHAGKNMKTRLLKLLRDIYDTGKVPYDFQKCIMVPIPKKTTATKCEQYRTLSLISHASKILVKIILKRVEKKVENILSEDQFGFRKGLGTREAILALRLIIERQMHRSKTTYVAFVDLEKAFDNVAWQEMFRVLKEAGCKYRDLRVIHSLYANEMAIIRNDYKEEEARIRKGVRQGCALSPLIFNAYIQEAIDQVRNRCEVGIKVNGQRIDMLRYADDIVVLAETKEDLENVLNTMENILSSKYGMRINKRKTKVMICGNEEEYEPLKVKIEEEELGEIKEFSYLGSRITRDGRSRREILSRIQQAKIAFNSRKNLFTSKNISLETRKRVMKAFVWSVALYGCETWTVGLQERKRLEALEMWCYRRMLKISWRDRVTNEEVLSRVKETKSLWSHIQKRRDNLVGHILRHDSLIALIGEGAIEGRNRRGRPRLSYMHQIQKDVGCTTYVEMKRKADKRKEWQAAANQPKG